MPCICIFLLCISWFLSVCSTVAANYITNTKFITDPETLVSSNAIFELGFFSPANSTHQYVGIWYNNKKDSESGISEVVWIANRDNSYGVFKYLN